MSRGTRSGCYDKRSTNPGNLMPLITTKLKLGDNKMQPYSVATIIQFGYY